MNSLTCWGRVVSFLVGLAGACVSYYPRSAPSHSGVLQSNWLAEAVRRMS